MFLRCPFCESTEAETVEVDGAEYAVVCRCCGAAGPSVVRNRHQHRMAAVLAAALLWNHRPCDEDPPAQPADRLETGVSSAAPITDPPGGGGGSVPHTSPADTAPPTQPPPAPTAKQKPATPVGGGEADITAAKVRQRLQKWLDVHGISISSAMTRDKIDLGASEPTVYKFAQGKDVSAATLAKINAALDRMFVDDETGGGEVGPKLPAIEVLPTKFAPVNGTNPPQRLDPPARHSRTS